MNYRKVTRPQAVPQSRPLPGRDMKQNLAGGFAFKADPWKALTRWLLVGSTGNAFYQGAEDMTQANMDAFTEVARQDPMRAAGYIAAASEKALSVHTPILALALLGRIPEGKRAFKEALFGTIRTASQLYELFGYAKDLKLSGRSHFHEAVKEWLDSRSNADIEFQFLKYQQREGWSGRDVLRLIKPKALDADRTAIYRWIVGKPTDGLPLRIKAFEDMKAGTVSAPTMIRSLGLSWEMIPGNVEMTAEVWQALFEKMPTGATLRNLANMTDKGLFAFNVKGNFERLAEKFTGPALRKARIHPMELLKALLVYQEGGDLGKSKLRWEPSGEVIAILNDAIDRSFDTLESIGATTVQGIDTSGSMWQFKHEGTGLEPAMIGALMALSFTKAEPMTDPYWFTAEGYRRKSIGALPINRKTSWRDVMDRTSPIWRGVDNGGTDCSLPIRLATERTVADAIIIWTDAQSWAGPTHVSEAFKEYRARVNPKAKFIEVVISPYGDRTSLVDPGAEHAFSLGGFSRDTPRLIQMILKGEL